MSNFEGVIKKSSKSFRPQQRGGSDAGVGKTVAGLWPGQEPVTVFEKSDQPVLDTDKTPRTDGLGESELNLSVDHPDRDGQAQYLAGKIARVYRKLTADGAGIETLSTEQRRQMRDQLIQGVYDGDGQHPSGEAGSESQRNTLAYITAVANVLFGVADEIPGTPEFLTRSEGAYMHKMEGGVDETECPHCHTLNRLDKLVAGAVGINTRTGLVTFTCTHCAKKWDENPSERAWFQKRMAAPAEPTLADLKKQLAEQVNILTERLRGLIARGSGVEITERNGSGRFVTKNKTVAEQELHKALQNGRPVPFSGADPRSEGEKASGSGRKFQPQPR